MNTPRDTTAWESANAFIERQTRELEAEFHTSRPRPRNRAMGFKRELRLEFGGVEFPDGNKHWGTW